MTILMLSIAVSGISQNAPDPRLEKAQKLEAEKKFDKALKLYEKIHKADPENNALTFKLAGLAYSLAEYQKAAKYYELLAPNGNPAVLYNLACTLSQSGKKTAALKYLGQAVDKGFNQLALMKTDQDLAAIRDEPGFAEILKTVKSIENYPEAQKFNFWVGEWQVFNAQGTVVGESKIVKLLSDAVILENWFGASGFEGKSFNHFHMESGKWIQYWVDQGSGRIYFEGNFDETQNAMVLNELDLNDAGKPQRRLSFFNLSPDSVRQFSQLSSDSGQTWSVEYDFMYVRKP